MDKIEKKVKHMVEKEEGFDFKPLAEQTRTEDKIMIL